MLKNQLCIAALSLLLLPFGQTQNYQSAESIEYDGVHNRFLISNGSNILARAADGTLTYFGSGSASYGMEVMGDHLFALEPSVLKVFDLESGMQLSATNISGSQFLNGLTNDGNGLLYATDFGAKKIYKMDVSDVMNPTFEIIVPSTGSTPNGIVYDGTNNRLIFTSWGANAKIKAVDLSDFTVSDLLTTSLSNIDGIDEDNQQNYYISSWGPNTARITKYDPNFENPVTVTTPSLSSPADIGYAKAIDTLAIPQGNSADYIGFEVVSNTTALAANDFNLLVFPNPATEQSWLQFELARAMEMRLQIVDASGKVYYESDRLEPAGVHRLGLRNLPIARQAGLELVGGYYLVRLEGEGRGVSVGFFRI